MNKKSDIYFGVASISCFPGYLFPVCYEKSNIQKLGFNKHSITKDFFFCIN